MRHTAGKETRNLWKVSVGKKKSKYLKLIENNGDSRSGKFLNWKSNNEGLLFAKRLLLIIKKKKKFLSFSFPSSYLHRPTTLTPPPYFSSFETNCQAAPSCVDCSLSWNSLYFLLCLSLLDLNRRPSPYLRPPPFSSYPLGCQRP